MDGPDSNRPSTPDCSVLDYSVRRRKAERRAAKVKRPIVSGVDIGIEPGVAFRRAEKP